MTISFLHPTYAALFALIPIIWLLRKETHYLQSLLRSLLLTLIILGLMQPVLLTTSESRHQVIIVDQSPSMGSENRLSAEQQAKVFISSLPDNDVDVIVIGTDATGYTNNNSRVVANPSLSLSQAVSLAMQITPYGKDGTISLFSDGLATDEHWEAVLAGLQQRNISLNWIKYDSPTAASLIQTVSYSPFILGEDTTLTAAVSVNPDDTLTYSVRVLAEDEIIQQGALQISNDNGLSVTDIPIAAVNQSFLPLTLQLVDNRNTIVDTKAVILAAQSAIPVLLGSENPADGEHLQQLLGKSVNVTQLPYPWDHSIDFARYDAVILNNAGSSSLPEQTQVSLSHAVENGTGLLYTGGEYAFSANGLSDTPIAALLPVSIDSIETKREPGISLAIIIDSSGSMQGQPIELAKQVARLAVRKLKPQDQVGIVEFYGTRQWAVPMQPARNTEELERAIGRLQAQGGSELFPAIEEAYFGLKSSHNKYRHILLITDAAVEEENYQKLLQYIASDQINVSTVLVGDNASGEERMSDLANWGQGRFYAIYNEFSMVELNFRRSDKMPSSSYKEGNFSVRNTNTDTLIPQPLNGFVAVPLKPGAVTEWAIDNTGDAALASWQFGAGKVSALMTEPFGTDTRNWKNWQGYGKEIANIISALSAFSKKSALKAQRTFDKVHVQFDTTSAIGVPALYWKTQTDDPWSELALRMRAPGIFSAELDIPRDQAVLLTVEQSNRALNAALEPNSDLRPEHQPKALYPQQLNLIVSKSAGQLYTSAQFGTASISTGQSYYIATALMPFAFLLALILYFTEIIYRRWPKRRNLGTVGNVV